MATERKNFFMVDNSIFSHGLKPRDIAVYCCICRHVNAKTGVAFTSKREIANDCGIGKTDTVDKAVKILIEKDLIEMHHQYSEDGSYKPNIYRLPGSQ